MLAGRSAVLMSAMSFLKPARWMQLLANNSRRFQGRRTSRSKWRRDEHRMTTWPGWISVRAGDRQWKSTGPRRHDPALHREVFPVQSFRHRAASVVRARGGDAVRGDTRAGTATGDGPFDYEKLSAGDAKRCGSDGGSELVSYGAPRSSTVRIVDPDTRIENPAGKIGEIWVHGDNVADGYWRNLDQTKRTWGPSSSIRRRARRTDRGCGTWASFPRVNCSSSAESRICSLWTGAT